MLWRWTQKGHEWWCRREDYDGACGPAPVAFVVRRRHNGRWDISRVIGFVWATLEWRVEGKHGTYYRGRSWPTAEAAMQGAERHAEKAC